LLWLLGKKQSNMSHINNSKRPKLHKAPQPPHKGAIYGTTVAGGYGKGICDPGGCGMTFELKPPAKKGGAWKEKVLYRFHGQDGAAPAAGLVFDTNGDLYGSAFGGANSGSGAVFALAAPAGGGTPWKETVLPKCGKEFQP
jgi:hypothetical protein